MIRKCFSQNELLGMVRRKAIFYDVEMTFRIVELVGLVRMGPAK